MRSNVSTYLLTVLFAGMMAAQAISAESPTEIEYLLQAIGKSECIFTRNGEQHSAAEAEDHLRMKYNRTRSRIKTAEAFIDNLASKSSWTGKSYTMKCADDEPEPSQQWLYRELARYRQL